MKACLLALAILFPASLGAQVAAPLDRTITGTIIDSVNGRALSGAMLFLPGRGTGIAAGSDGRFRLEKVAPLDTIVYVRRIGYVPAPVAIPVSASAIEIDLGTVRLRPVATTLDRIAVEADEVRIYPHLADFYRRKQLKLPGYFLTRDDIQRVSYRKTSDLISRTGKLTMDCPDFDWQNQRGASRGDPCRARNSRPQGQSGMAVGRCEMDVWIDGERSAVRIDEVPVSMIAGIEVYSGPASTPTVFGSGHCGVVAIWTTTAGAGH